MTKLDLIELRKKAEAATPGEWTQDGHHMSRVIKCTAERGSPEARHLCGDYITVADAGENWMVDAPFIAAANPAVVLALIDRVEKAEAPEMVCLSCGTVSRGGTCHCTDEGMDSRRAVNRLQWHKEALDKADDEVARLRSLLTRAGEALNGMIGARMEHGWRISGASSLNAALPTARTVAREIREAIGHE